VLLKGRKERRKGEKERRRELRCKFEILGWDVVQYSTVLLVVRYHTIAAVYEPGLYKGLNASLKFQRDSSTAGCQKLWYPSWYVSQKRYTAIPARVPELWHTLYMRNMAPMTRSPSPPALISFEEIMDG